MRRAAGASRTRPRARQIAQSTYSPGSKRTTSPSCATAAASLGICRLRSGPTRSTSAPARRASGGPAESEKQRAPPVGHARVFPSPAFAAGDPSARVPLTDPMTVDQACAPPAPELLADQARPDCPRFCAFGLPPDAPTGLPRSSGHATPAEASCRNRRLGPRSIVPSARKAAGGTSAPATHGCRASRKTEVVAKRGSGAGAWLGRGRRGAYWPRLATCVLRGGSARSRSIRSTSARNRSSSAPASCWLGGCLIRSGLIWASLRSTS